MLLNLDTDEIGGTIRRPHPECRVRTVQISAKVDKSLALATSRKTMHRD
jgi:hypothetical protein